MPPPWLARLRQVAADYPRQFWLLFWGLLLNAIGGSMVWPFLTIYLRRELDVSLTTVTLLLTLNAVAGLAATSLAGPAVDRFGRETAMLLSLAVSGAVLGAMSLVSTLGGWQFLMIMLGGFGPIYRVAADAMVADLIPGERRPGAYALLRMISHLGVAIGPALHDRPFLLFCAVYTLAGMAYSLMMVLLPVYAKESFGVPESQYGFILATNAVMVVLFQYGVTRLTVRFSTLRVLAVGSLFYAVGVGRVAPA